MKKFYEVPVVEITEFDKESIMTNSVIDTAAIDSMKAFTTEYTSIANNIYVVEEADTSVYGW